MTAVINNLKPVYFRDLGLVDYKQTWDLQGQLHAEVVKRKLENRELPKEQKQQQSHYLLFCEHPHVYTLGKTGKEDHLLLNQQGLKENDAEYFHINRGGDITYHGPGQIVGYPILDLDEFFTDIHKYLRYLEEAVILTLKEYNIEAGRVEGLTGVWIDAENPSKARKICAMGVHCSRWVTMHGFAFNVNTDLKYFNNIIPCGINDKSVTSLETEIGRRVDIEEVKTKLKQHLAILFGMDLL